MNVWILLKFSPTRGTKQQSYWSIGFYQTTILAKHYIRVSFGKNISCLCINFGVLCVMNQLCFKTRRSTHISLQYLLWLCTYPWSGLNIEYWCILQNKLLSTRASLPYRARLISAKSEKFLKLSNSPTTWCYKYREQTLFETDMLKNSVYVLRAGVQNSLVPGRRGA